MTPLSGTKTPSAPVGDAPTRDTAFIAVGARGVTPPETSVRTTAPAGKSLFSGSPLFAIVHYCSSLFAIVRVKILSGASAPTPSTPATRPVRFSRITQHGFPCLSGDFKESNPRPGQWAFHETRLFSPSGSPCPPSSHVFPIHGCPLLPGSPAAKLLLPAMARYFPAFLPPGHGLPAHGSPRLPTRCPRLPMSARYCSLQRLPAASLRTASDFRSASRRAPGAAAPVALRAAPSAANAK